MDIQEALQKYLVALNETLKESAETFLVGPPELDLMLKYHLGWVDVEGHTIEKYSGKQLRPALVLLAAEAAGGDWQQALPAAAAVELLHNFSLIHDDIQDGSMLRRGQPALWNIWGIPKAINAGDTMFAWAHAALLELVIVGVNPSCVVEILALFEKTNLALTRGQHLDICFEDSPVVAVDEYMDMISGKSAALIATSMQLGALVAGLSLDSSSLYAKFGICLGLAFQIHDDILGIWGDVQVTGKSSSSDIAQKKKSLPVLYGLNKSSALGAIYRKELLSADDVVAATAILDQIGAREYAQERERYYSDQAAVLLRMIGVDSVAGKLLLDLMEFLLGRVL